MAEASSDVSPEKEERRAAIVISRDDVSTLAEQLNDVAGKWELFLGLLKVSLAKQEQIKSSRANQPAYAQICLVDGLQHWVVSDPSPTVEKVIAALSSRTINNKLLAAEIARKWGIQAFVENPAPELRSICTAASELAIARPESRMLFDKLEAEAKSSELRDCFISMVGDLKQHLKETKTDDGLPKFRDEFILKLPLSIREDNEKCFNRNNTEINKATTFDELFTCLSTYWSYLNHSLLGGIILRYGTEELKDNIKAFSRKVDEFRKVTTIEVFQEIEPSPRVVPPAGFQEFVTKHALSLTSTLEDIECIRHEFCEKFHLHKFAFYLVRVLKGSVLITWLVPHSVARLVEAGMTQELKKALHIEDIMYGDKSGVKKDDATPIIEASTSVAISALAKATTLSKEDPPEEEKGQEHEFEHDNRKLDFADLTIGEKIGEGGFGTVFRGTVMGLSGEVAIKRVDAESSAKELDHLCTLKHPNIIKLYGTASKDIQLYIVTELAGHGSLYGHIQKTRGQPDMELSVHWATGVARGMSYLHENDVVHRDLKSANVLLTSNKTAKLCCDFGVSKKMDHTTKATMTGTYPWMAPEVIIEAAYSKRCNLFSYGTVLWELVTHDVPFEELKGVTFQILMAITSGQMPPIPESVEGYLSTLIQSCWDKDPYSRPSFVEVLSILAAKGIAEHQTQATHAHPPVTHVEPAQAAAQGEQHTADNQQNSVLHPSQQKHSQQVPAAAQLTVPLLYDPPEPAEIAAVLVSVQDWYTVGIRLDMSIADLDIIKHNGKTSEDKKRAMGRLWLELMEASGGQPSWRTLLPIVSNMGATKSAELIRRNYRPGVPRPDPLEEFPIISIDSKPKMKHLQYIPDLSGSIRVVQEIASEWEVVARQLDVSEGVIRQLKRAKSGRLEEQCIDSLELWLNGACKKPVTWETLVAVLFDAQYITLAKKLLARLK